jgi:methyl-accepting chemotaxis protein
VKGVDFMEHNVERVRELLDASIQIIDHMEESGETASQVKQIKQAMQQQLRQLSSGTIVSTDHLQSSISQITQMVAQLEDQTLDSYNEATGNAMEQFEMKSLDEQLHASHAYHEKIDFKSMKKIKQNLEEIKRLPKQ